MTGVYGLPISWSWDASDGLNIWTRDHTGTLRYCIPARPTTISAVCYITIWKNRPCLKFLRMWKVVVILWTTPKWVQIHHSINTNNLDRFGRPSTLLCQMNTIFKKLSTPDKWTILNLQKPLDTNYYRHTV